MVAVVLSGALFGTGIALIPMRTGRAVGDQDLQQDPHPFASTSRPAKDEVARDEKVTKRPESMEIPISVRGGEDAVKPREQAESSDDRSRLETWQRKLEAHDAEPIDGSWAQEWSAALHGDFSQIAEGTSLTVESIDCRSSTCAVELAWPSYADALSQWRNVLVHPYAANCARDILLAEPSEADGMESYRTRVLFGSCMRNREL